MRAGENLIRRQAVDLQLRRGEDRCGLVVAIGHDQEQIRRFYCSRHDRTVRRAQELELGEATADGWQHFELPLRMEVQIDLVDHHDPAVSDESPAVRATLAYVVEEVSNPSDVGAESV